MWSSVILFSALMAAGSDFFTQAALEKAYDDLRPAIGIIRYSLEVTDPASGEVSRRDNNALGLIVAPDGLVMTFGHMAIENTQPFNIVFTMGQGSEERRFDATLLKKPDDVNVVFLRLKSDAPLDLPYVRFSKTHNLGLAAPVALFGMLGETLDFVHGIQEARVAALLEKPRATYCLDQNVRFGYVGGPVIDTAGRVVGVVGFDLSRAEGGDVYSRSGHPLLYQTELFQKYIDSPPSLTEAQRAEDYAWLGVFTQPLTDDFAEYWGLPKEGGLIVSTVVAPSPAVDAGLQPGDVIIDFDGTPIRSKLDSDVLGFTKLVREAEPGREVSIRILRGGETQDIRVRLGVRPRSSRDAGEYEEPIFGLTVREITTDIRIALNLSEDVQGVIVRRVRSGSAAQLANMRPGVIIMSFGDYPVSTLDEFRDAVNQVAAKRPAEVSVFARVGPATGFFRLEPRWQDNE